MLDVLLFADHKVFDEMAKRNLNLNFGFKLGGFSRHILGSIGSVGLVKGHWFGWILKRCDLHIC